VAKGTSKRQSHVRFGFAAKIDRPVVDLVRHRGDELRICGKVSIAADRIHCNPRNAQLLAPVGVELRESRDGGYLAEQTQLPRVGRQAQMTKMILAKVVSAQIGRPKK